MRDERWLIPYPPVPAPSNTIHLDAPEPIPKVKTIELE